MSGEEDAGLGGVGVARRKFSEGVAFFVEMRVAEAEGAEAVEEPGGAGGFPKGGRGNGQHLELPEQELGLVEVEPAEGAMDGYRSRQAGDAVLGKCGLDVHLPCYLVWHSCLSACDSQGCGG